MNPNQQKLYQAIISTTQISRPTASIIAMLATDYSRFAEQHSAYLNKLLPTIEMAARMLHKVNPEMWALLHNLANRIDPSLKAGI